MMKGGLLKRDDRVMCCDSTVCLEMHELKGRKSS
jgi:hypothetical protein